MNFQDPSFNDSKVTVSIKHRERRTHGREDIKSCLTRYPVSIDYTP